MAATSKLLRTANCSFSLHSRFVKLTKQVKSSYSAIEKEKQDSAREEKWEEQSGFVRAGNFVLSHFISTAFVKTGLIGEKGLFTSTDGRKCLFSLPLSDSSVLVGPSTALGAFLSALKPPTLDPKAYVVCVCVRSKHVRLISSLKKHIQICKTSYRIAPDFFAHRTFALYVNFATRIVRLDMATSSPHLISRKIPVPLVKNSTFAPLSDLLFKIFKASSRRLQ